MVANAHKGVGGEGGSPTGDGLYLPIGLFGVSMSPRCASHYNLQDILTGA